MIFHVDMDAFFVSVERLLRPELEGLPVVVGGSPDSRGVVAAASYEARRFGVHSAQSMSRAMMLCPQLIRISADHHHYGEYSKKLEAILDRFSPVVQKVSVDEAYLDMSGTERLWGTMGESARLLQGTIRKELDLPCSVGGGANRLIAKIASGQAKPEGICLIPPGGEQAFLDPLPVGMIPGVGEVAGNALADMGVALIADLRAIDEEELRRQFGIHGRELAARARGEGSMIISSREGPKSVSRETTFATDVKDRATLRSVLARLLDRAAVSLREEGLLAGGVAVKLRYADFRTPSRSEKLVTPSAVDTVLMPVARRLLDGLWDERPDPVRLLGVRLERLVTEGQMGLFDQPSRRWEKAMEGVDRIRERHGHGSLRWGRELTGGEAGREGERAEGDGLREEL